MIPSHLYSTSFPTGSNYICNPPVTNTDIDTMYLVYNLQEAHHCLIRNNWEPCLSEDKKDTYQDLNISMLAYRQGIHNALITESEAYFLDFYKATEEAKKLNLLNKEDRIKLFNKYIDKYKKVTKKLTGYIPLTYTVDALLDEPPRLGNLTAQDNMATAEFRELTIADMYNQYMMHRLQNNTTPTPPGLAYNTATTQTI